MKSFLIILFFFTTVAFAAKCPSRKILDPVEPKEFEELFRLEAKQNKLKPIPPMSVAESFSVWINRTTSLKYYFKYMSTSDLSSYGLRVQSNWLRVLPGEDLKPVDLRAIAYSLSLAVKKHAQSECDSSLHKS